MSTNVDLPFLCTSHRVSERGLQCALRELLLIEGHPISIETLAERIDYSPEQTKRLVRALTWHDPDRHIPPVVFRHGGTKGRPYKYPINFQRGRQLGLINDAA